jgi:S1-C subfamily serine protease
MLIKEEDKLKYLFWVVIPLIFSLNLYSNNSQTVYKKTMDSVLVIKIKNATTGIEAGHGSGALFSVDGLVVTNFHVIENYIQSKFKSKYLKKDYIEDVGIEHFNLMLEGTDKTETEKYKLEVVTYNINKDIAILKILDFNIEQSSIQPITFSSTPPEMGDTLFSMGKPISIGVVIEEGIYNGLNKDPTLKDKEFNVFLGSINSGMSGGPVVNKEGHLVGINVATYVGQESLGLFVSLENVKKLIENPKEVYDSYFYDFQKDSVLDNFKSLKNANIDNLEYKGLKIPYIKEDFCGTSTTRTYISCQNIHYAFNLQIDNIDVIFVENNATSHLFKYNNKIIKINYYLDESFWRDKEYIYYNKEDDFSNIFRTVFQINQLKDGKRIIQTISIQTEIKNIKEITKFVLETFS